MLTEFVDRRPVGKWLILTAAVIALSGQSKGCGSSKETPGFYADAIESGSLARLGTPSQAVDRLRNMPPQIKGTVITRINAAQLKAQVADKTDDYNWLQAALDCVSSGQCDTLRQLDEKKRKPTPAPSPSDSDGGGGGGGDGGGGGGDG